MHRTLRAALVAASCFAATALASAAAAASGAPSWTGVYAGADLGGRWSSVNGTVNSATDNGVNILVPGSRSASVGDANSFRGGIFVGYQDQVAPNWVLGVEGDVGFGQNNKTLAHAIYPGNAFFVTGRPDDSFTAKQTWDASVRARAGYLVTPSTMIYATGGVAWTELKSTSTCGVLSDCRPGVFALLFAPATINNTTDPVGWTLGGGLEWNAGDHLLVRGEYRYSDYGRTSETETRVTPAGPTTQVTNFGLKLTTSTAMLGVAYAF